jgi:hypothetical protein
MRGSRIPRLATCVAIVALLAGCATGFGSPEAVRDHVSSLTGVPYVDESGFTVGKSALAMTRMALDLAGEETPAVIEDLKDIRVGIYRAERGPSDGLPDRRLGPDDFRAYDPLFAVKAKSGEDILLLTRGRGGSVRQLLLVIDGVRRLTVVQVRGDLDEILAAVLQYALGKADRSDLAPLALDALAGGSGIEDLDRD